MSKTIDQRVVEMQFDNKQFERNVSTTMSTLDKLKQKLHLDGATKGLENVNTAARKVDMAGLGSGVEAVRMKFSALEVMGVTALANITNQAVNAGKRIVSALTIDPVKTGFQEYETQINSVQTILANTESKGSTLDDVNKALETLNKYADKTIYNFTEMTRNIGTFTAAGIDLDTSVNAIQGIANLAAVSGSNAQQASTAMYQLSQALASGTVKLMDWNSVVNAGMGGQVFQDALKETARVHGVAIDKMIKEQGSFRETLSEGWLTADILTETLQKFTLTTEGLTEEQIEANREMLRAKGYTEDQIEQIFKLGDTATNAATKVKTFTQLWDVLKEAAQSGWSQTWKLIIGDFEEAKGFFTPISESLTDIINKMSDARNAFVKKLVTKPWDRLTEKIEEAGISTGDFKEALIETAKKHGISVEQMIEKEGSFEKTLSNGWLTKDLIIETLNNYVSGLDGASTSTEDMTEKLRKFQKVVNEVWRGDYKNGKERIDALTKAGYDYAEVQALVNKTVDGHKLTLEDLSDAQLKNIGYTDEQIQTIRKLAEEAKKAGTPLNELLEDMAKPSAKDLLIDSVKNILEEFSKPLKTIKEAWDNAFGNVDMADTVYNIIEKIHELTEALNVPAGSVENFTRIFEGALAAWELSWGMIAASFTNGIKLLRAVLSLFGLDITDVMAYMADYIVKLRDWVEGHTIYIGVVDKLAQILKVLIDGIKQCFDAFMSLEVVQHAISKFGDIVGKIFGKVGDGFNAISVDNFCAQIKKAFDALSGWIKNLDQYKEAGKNIVDGLIQGLSSGIQGAVAFIKELGSKLIESFCNLLGIQSPSKVFMALGGFIIAGLILGLQNGTGEVWDAIRSVFDPILDWVKNIDFGKVFSVAIAASMLFVAKKVYDTVALFEAPIRAISGMFSDFGSGVKKMLSGIGEMFSGIGESIKANVWKKRAKAIKDFAIAIGILAASVWLLSKVEATDLIAPVVAVAALAAIIGGLAFAISKFGAVDVKVEFTKIATMLVGISASILIIAAALKVMSGIDEDALKRSGLAIAGIGVIVAGLIAVTKFAGKDLGNLGSTMIKLSAAILILAYVAKVLSDLPQHKLDSAIIFILDMALIMGVLAVIGSYTDGGFNKVGTSLLKMSAAVLLMVGVAKILSTMSESEIKQAVLAITAFGAVIAGLVAATRLAGGNKLDKVGSTLLAMSASMVLLALVGKLIASMTWEELGKAVAGIAVLGAVVAGLVAITKYAGGNDLAKVGTTLLLMSISIGILAAVSMVLGLLKLEHLAKGVAAVSILSVMMSMMVVATKYASDAKGTMIGMAIMIGVLTASVAALSFIDVNSLAKATTAMTILIGAMALLAQATGSLKDVKMGPLIMMVGVIAVLTGAIALLTYMNADSALESAASLSLLLVSLSASMAILSKASGVTAKAVVPAMLMGLVIGELAVVLGLMSYFNIANAIPNAIALSVLLTAMATAMGILKLIGPSALAGVGALAVMGLVVGELAIILGLMSYFDVNPSIETVTALSLFLISMSAALVILGAVGALGPAAFVGIAALATLIAGIGGLVVGIGALMDKFPQLEEFLNTGIPVIEKIGYALGSFFGNIVGGFLGNVTSGLPDMATDLSTFMTNLQPFIDGAKSIDESTMTGVQAIADTVMTLTGAKIMDSLTSWFTGGSSLADFGSQLVPFGQAMVEFSAIVSGNINEESVIAAANAGKVMAELAAMIPNTGGVVSWFAGDNDMTTFSSQFVPFGRAMVAFSNTVSGKINEDAVVAAANAGKVMAEMANTIPNAGGVVSWFTGDNDLITFGAQLVPFGVAMAAFSATVAGKIDEAAVTAAANAGMIMAEMATTIPNTGGLVSWFTGDNDMSTFGLQLISFGSSMAQFSATVSGKIDEGAITASATAGKVLAEMAATLPNSGGVVSWFTGDNDLASFAEGLIPFGDAMTKYSSSVAGINVGAIENASSAVKTLVKTINNTASVDASGTQSFVNAVNTLGEASVTGFVNAFSTSMGKIEKAGSMMVESLSKGVLGKQTLLLTAANTLVLTLVEALNSKAKLFDATGNALMVAFALGLESQFTAIASAVSTMVSSAVDTIGQYYSGFYSAGGDLVAGFAAGISANTFMAAATASAMAAAALAAAKSALKINSPSKVFRAIGYSVPEGFAMGIDKMSGMVTKSSVGMANTAINGVSDAISKISRAIDSDIDSQPTIRPVLDLSDVRSGTGYIKDMLSLGSSIGVMTNVGAISTMMGQRGQNGANDDVVSAINKLHKDLDKIGGPSYQINGVTYDDGSNITNAVEEIVRAARIERRV